MPICIRCRPPNTWLELKLINFGDGQQLLGVARGKGVREVKDSRVKVVKVVRRSGWEGGGRGGHKEGRWGEEGRDSEWIGGQDG